MQCELRAIRQTKPFQTHIASSQGLYHSNTPKCRLDQGDLLKQGDLLEQGNRVCAHVLSTMGDMTLVFKDPQGTAHLPCIHPGAQPQQERLEAMLQESRLALLGPGREVPITSVSVLGNGE